MSDLEGIQSLPAGSEPVLWLFAGDSITHGAVHTLGWRSYVEHFAERVRTELGRHRDHVINSGVSGFKTDQLLADLEHLVLRFEPKVISVMMGMNDAAAGPDGRQAFKANYAQLLERLRAETKALLIVHTPNPITPTEPFRQDLPAYVDVIRELATRYEPVVVDQFARWNERRTPLDLLLDDGTIHPNHYGHMLMAHNLFKALGIWDPASATCSLEVP
jgi:lysophospholipase L1-like esterase